MNCYCGVIIDTNHKRCETCRLEIKRAKNKVDAKRQRERRHARGLVTTHAKGGKEHRVNAQCMRCRREVTAAANRRNTTLCQSCRTVSNRVKSLGQYHKRNPKPQTVTLGDVCCICKRPFVRGLCECKE